MISDDDGGSMLPTPRPAPRFQSPAYRSASQRARQNQIIADAERRISMARTAWLKQNKGKKQKKDKKKKKKKGLRMARALLSANLPLREEEQK